MCELNKQIKKIGDKLNVEKALIYALIKTESKGDFSLKGKKIRILYERHVLYRILNKKDCELAKKMQEKYPKLCNKLPGEYGKFSAQYKRLAKAIKYFGVEEAHLSCSFGAFQIMGFNHTLAGYKSAKEMSDSYHDNPQENQINSFIRFVSKYKQGKLLDAMKENDFAEIARLYNGKNYKINSYDTKLKDYYIKYHNENT